MCILLQFFKCFFKFLKNLKHLSPAEPKKYGGGQPGGPCFGDSERLEVVPVEAGARGLSGSRQRDLRRGTVSSGFISKLKAAQEKW